MISISFIITYYNEPQALLEECIQSVLSLPLRPDEREILVVDDGSKEPLSDIKGVSIVRQENQGLSAARNRGLELAQGEYIQFLDADDFLLPDAYSQVLGLLSEQLPDMLMFGFTHKIPMRRNCLKGVERFHSGIDFLRTRNMRASAWGYLFRRSILQDLRFYPGILHEDELFTPQLLLKAGSLLVADISPYYYRVRTSTITHQQDRTHVQKRLDDTFFVIRQLNKLARTLPDEARDALARRVSQLTMDYIYNVFRQTHDGQERRARISALREAGLYPLPVRTYTFKYWLSALMSHIAMI
ncbi:MAG: glycosyltransferase family 2 protein [Bacteroidaceae bacterium]|nr:glycosyltransferase family 2 protein [Bacteroidaceae bacterium]